jgi:hypothetical protein
MKMTQRLLGSRFNATRFRPVLCAFPATFLAFLFVGLPVLQAQARIDPQVIEGIKEEGLQRSEVLGLYAHLTDAIGPRLTGSPAFKEAVDWAAARLNGWGLENVHLEAWEFGRGWTLDGLTMEMTAPRYFPLTGFPEAWTPSTNGTVLTRPV